MRILLTGSKGFLGQGFIQRYGNDYDIVEYDRNRGKEELSNYIYLKSKMLGCDQVVHLAAIPKPVLGKSFDDYLNNNVLASYNVVKAAVENGLKRVVYASSTTIYGIEKGIPFSSPIKENQPFVSQYLTTDKLSCRDIDLSYHVSKVIAEQIMAWYGLNKKIQTTTLRFGPINKVFLGTSVSMNNATQAIKLALEYKGEFWYEPFSIVDEVAHIDISKAKKILGYNPEKTNYTGDQLHSTFEERTK